jgi:pimeloyl-ACP methyl ester carboxylesterase
MEIADTTPQFRGQSTSLVVVLHAPTSCPENMDGVKSAVMETMRDADLLIPRLPLHLSSNADPVAITIALLEAIDSAERRRSERLGEGYSEIILIGHCVGALLVRKLYVFSQGENDDAVFETTLERRPWAHKVTRIILLAGLNRGWSIESNLPRAKSALLRFGEGLARLLDKGHLWISCRRGADFITELRIQWLSMLRHNDRPAPTIQLLGTIDDLVIQDDDIDLQIGKNFIYLEVPHSGHKNIIDFEGEAGAVRRAVFVDALTTSEQHLKNKNELQIAPEHEPDATIRNVVFIVHGIRDHGFWTNRVARKIQRVAREEGQKYITITSSYGYFPMWPFIFSYFKRQMNVFWLMDQYTLALAKYPNARFSFVGHSNGTYLLASALKMYPSCRFDRVVFAGSVIRTTFPWDQMITAGRIREIRNFVATSDWVVAVFPGVYEQLGISDLGRSGSDGFKPHLPVDQHKWVVGGHNAAIKEESWQSIAEFIVKGRSAPAPKLRPAPSRIIRLLSAGALVCWLLLVCAVVGLFWLVLSAWPESWKGISNWWLLPATLYFFGLYYALNKI